MPDKRVWTAAELERLTPDERQRLLNERVITDLSQVHRTSLARVRGKGRVLLEERGVVPPQGDGA